MIKRKKLHCLNEKSLPLQQLMPRHFHFEDDGARFEVRFYAIQAPDWKRLLKVDVPGTNPVAKLHQDGIRNCMGRRVCYHYQTFGRTVSAHSIV